jgi:hypothetical protein
MKRSVRTYPWDDWFGRKTVTIMRGVHYRCSQSTMQQIIRNNASARGLSVRIQDGGTTLTIKVTGGKNNAVPHTDPPAVPEQLPVALAVIGPD